MKSNAKQQADEDHTRFGDLLDYWTEYFPDRHTPPEFQHKSVSLADEEDGWGMGSLYELSTCLSVQKKYHCEGVGVINVGLGIDNFSPNMAMNSPAVYSLNKHGYSLEWWKMASRKQVSWCDYVADADSLPAPPAIVRQLVSEATHRLDIQFKSAATDVGCGHGQVFTNCRHNDIDVSSTCKIKRLELPAENGGHRGSGSELCVSRGSADNEEVSAYWLSAYNTSYTLLELIELVSPAVDEKGGQQEDYKVWIPVNRFDQVATESQPLFMRECMWFDDFVATDVVADDVTIVDISTIVRPRRRWRRRLQARPKRTFQERVCTWRARRVRITRKPGQFRMRTVCFTACNDCLHVCTADDVTFEFTDMFDTAVSGDRLNQLLDKKRRTTCRQSDDHDIHAG